MLDPASAHDAVTTVSIRGRRIEALGGAADPDLPQLDATGLLVIPGLIDLATHLREPGEEEKASIASETRAAAAGGITCLCASPDTDPVTDSTAVVELITRRARQAHLSRVMPVGALTCGLQGGRLTEMAALKAAGCIALSDGGRPVRDGLVLLRALEYAATVDLTVFLTPQDPDLSAAGRVHDGWVATRMGLRGIPVAAETAAIGRILALVEHTGARVHLGRLSSGRGAAMVAEAKDRGLPVTADVAIHQLFLSEMDLSGYDTRCLVTPPLRSDEDRRALREAVRSGVIDAICSDHQPQDADAKAATLDASLPGISGLDTLLPLLLRLVDDGVLDLPTALARVTAGPARVLGIDRGSLQPGHWGDLCLLDPEQPRWVDPEQLLSRGRNTPFTGWDLAGQVRCTVLEGRLIHGAEHRG